MSAISLFVVVAGVTIDLVAAWHLLRGWKETSEARIRAITNRTRMLAALAFFLGFSAPVAGVAIAFKTAESVDPEQRAASLAEGISEAMNGALLGMLFAVPCLIIALFLKRRSRVIQRMSAVTEP